MNELKIFENPAFGSVRIIEDAESNQPLFNALDVCKALGYANVRDAVAKHVDKPDVAKCDAWVVTGKKADGTDAKRKTSMTFVTESGLYSLIFGSKLERAKEFKRWVTSEVLPAIRKDGGYMVARQEESDEDLMARAWAVAMKTLKRREERIRQLEQDTADKQSQIEDQSKAIEEKNTQIVDLSSAITKMQPKVDYLDTILASTDTVPISNIAQDYGYSAKKFNVLLRNYNIQRKVGGAWVLYAKYLPEGYVQSKTFTYQKANGGQGSRSYTEWTQKGRIFLYNFLKAKGILPAIEKPQQPEPANA